MAPDTPASTPPTLNDLRPGRRARVRRHRAAGPVRQRLLDLGILPGTCIAMVRSAPLNDPVEIRVGAVSVTLRRHEARTIEVEADDA
ncbi:ferrous iron transport protein A [Ectothiorhodospira mobilis]|nr:ferrous iron transport protein A [Ectothiorhodospira mobilis]